MKKSVIQKRKKEKVMKKEIIKKLDLMWKDKKNFQKKRKTNVK